MSYTPGTAGFNLPDTDMAYRTGYEATNDTAGASAKLWLPIWSGEVLHAYDEYRSFEPMVTSKTIASGREMEFPITGTVDLKPAWSAGEYLVGGENATGGNFSIMLDNRPMAAHFELDNVDLMITQWEYRQELARQAGQTLANARDKQIAAFIAGAAAVELTSADPRTGLTLPAPAVTTAVDTAEEALEVLEAIEDFVVDCQENSVPVGTTYCAVTPRLFQQIRRLGVAESGTPGDAKNMQPMFGGVAAAGGLGASFTQGMNSLSDSLVYMGVTILKSNHLPTVDYSAAAIGEARYNVDGSSAGAGIRGLIWMPECVASLRKTGLVVDTEDDIRRNTTFTVASMMSGTGILKPELAKAIVG
ncbi:MAG: hypothetical protein GY871_04815, partial [Actinomycetales bacterium]|nr:hypothetical protein [Actinomycetales bacterium]